VCMCVCVCVYVCVSVCVCVYVSECVCMCVSASRENPGKKFPRGQSDDNGRSLRNVFNNYHGACRGQQQGLEQSMESEDVRRFSSSPVNISCKARFIGVIVSAQIKCGV